MGWYGTPGKNRQDIIDEVLGDLGECKLDHKIKYEDGETVLWVVVAGITDQGDKYQYVICYLIQKGGECWGYKPMDETMGPCYYSVPKAWLTKYPCITPTGHTGYSAKWREKVLETA